MRRRRSLATESRRVICRRASRAGIALATLLCTALVAEVAQADAGGIAQVARTSRVASGSQQTTTVVVTGAATVHIDVGPDTTERHFWGAAAARPGVVVVARPADRPTHAGPLPQYAPPASRAASCGAACRPAPIQRPPRHTGLLSKTAASAERSYDATREAYDPLLDPLLEATTDAAGTVAGTAIGIAIYPPLKLIEHLF